VPLLELLRAGCHIWLRPPPFDHSKLMTIDDVWSLIGSANWDTRSFRLNFELNVEIKDEAFARRLAEVTAGGRDLLMAELDREPLVLRLRNNAARLLQPYL
jgi:cardiolipin synthase